MRSKLHVLVVVLAAALFLVPAARAATPFVDITSAGPLTDIFLGNELSCQVAHTGDTSYEFYPPGTTPGDCGTFLSTGGQLYAPDFVSHGVTATANLGSYTPFTPVSQSAVTGAGTTASPFRVTTTVAAGSTGLSITEVDSYVVGDENYRSDITVANSGSSSQTGLLYHAGDCFLQNSDLGFGFVDSTRNAPACTANANNTPPGRIEEIVPITGSNHYVETFFGTVWADIGAQGNLPDTCDCTTNQDNGAGVNWDITVPAGGSVKFSTLTVFSPLGNLALATSKTADAGTANAGSSDGYTITIANPNSTSVTLTDITDTLPSGFTYTPGSSTGVTTSDPSVSGQSLTWAGPFTVPASGNVTLHFNVTVASTGGTYFNNAGGDSSFTVTPTGPTAQINVTAIIGPPTATITTPPNGATYTQGQAVNASYSCTDATGGPGIASCTGPVASGSPIDTSTAGPHSFTVTATSLDGQTGTATSNYTVTSVTTTGCRMRGEGYFGRHPVDSVSASLSSDLTKSQRLRFVLNGKTFVLTSLSSATCLKEPGLNPGPGHVFNSLKGAGSGTYGGRIGFTVKFELGDGGQNGSGNGGGRDRVTVRVFDSHGGLVVTAHANLNSTRLPHGMPPNLVETDGS